MCEGCVALTCKLATARGYIEQALEPIRKMKRDYRSPHPADALFCLDRALAAIDAPAGKDTETIGVTYQRNDDPETDEHLYHGKESNIESPIAVTQFAVEKESANAAHSEPAPRNEFAWLAERVSVPGSPMYFGGDYWTCNPNEAVRFVRKRDTESAIRILALHPHAKAIERGHWLKGEHLASHDNGRLVAFVCEEGVLCGPSGPCVLYVADLRANHPAITAELGLTEANE